MHSLWRWINIFSPGRGLCDLQSIWLQFIFMKLRHASYSKVADQENGWQCFLQWNVLLSLKSRFINRTIYKLMGKVISPGFVIFNTHFMQRERKLWVPWIVYLNCRNPCFCPQVPATSLYLTTDICKLLANSTDTSDRTLKAGFIIAMQNMLIRCKWNTTVYPYFKCILDEIGFSPII